MHDENLVLPRVLLYITKGRERR